MAKMIRNLICGISLHHPLGGSTCNWIVHLDTIFLLLIFQYSRKLLPIRRRCPAGCSLAHQLRRLTVWDWAPLSLFLSYMHMCAHPLTLSLSLIHSHANPHSFSLSHYSMFSRKVWRTDCRRRSFKASFSRNGGDLNLRISNELNLWRGDLLHTI